MSKKFVDATARRTWDKEEYERRAKERLENEGVEEVEKAPKPTALLKQRKFKLDLESNVGKTKTISSMNEKTGGYYCSACDCTLKDSMVFLDHINGIKHQQNMGMSMNVERSTVAQVRERIEWNRKRIKDKQAEKAKAKDFDFDTHIAALQEEAELKKKHKKEQKRERKLAKTRKTDDNAPQAEFDPEMAAMMGFSGFGSTKKG
eukprot:m.489422 g.489422  ORF g.489422 m.489422 type:complete len:204 (-) comp26729_c0_seq1:40-651(-)